MKITDIRLFQVEGVLEHEEELWEERLVRPIDVYPEFRAQGAQHTPKIAEGQYRVVAPKTASFPCLKAPAWA